MELLSATMKSEQENYSVTVVVSSSFLSFVSSVMFTGGAMATRLGRLLKEIDLIVLRLMSSNHATTLNLVS